MKKIKIIKPFFYLIPIVIMTVVTAKSIQFFFSFFVNNTETDNIVSNILNNGINYMSLLFSCVVFIYRYKISFIRKCYRILLYFYNMCNIQMIDRILQKFINIFTSKNNLTIDKETFNIEIIRKNIISNKESKIFFLVGESYSGKTYTMLSLLKNIIINDRFLEIYEKSNGKFAYCDIQTNNDLENFKRRYMSNQYNNYILIIDNIYRSSESTIFELIDFLNKEVLSALSIIIVMRKPEEFLFNSQQIKFLYKQIKKIGTTIEFYSLDTEYRKQSNQLIYNNLDLASYCLTDEDVKEYPFLIIPLALIEKSNNQLISKKVFANIINGEKTDLFLFCIIITTSCIFSESIEKKKVFELAKKYKISKLKVKKLLDQLYEANLISFDYYNLNNKKIFMHEKISSFILNKTYCHNETLYYDLSSNLYYYYKKNENIFLQWAYSLIVRDSISNEYNKNIFDVILLNSNHKSLIDLINQLKHLINVKNITILREISLLKKLSGNHEESINILLDYFDKSNDLRAIINLIEVKHSYLFKYKYLFELYDTKKSYIYQSFLYWKIHINMHAGSFLINDMIDQLKIFNNSIDFLINENLFEGIYFLKRWYLDFYKLLYIQGSLNIKPLLTYSNMLNQIKEFVSKNISDFIYTIMIYCQADFIQYIILFRYNFLGILPNMLDNELVNNQQTRLMTVEEYYDYALNLYEEGIKNLKATGRRSIWAAKLRLADLLMLKANKENDFIFIEEAVISFLNYSHDVHRPEFTAMALTFLLKIYLIKKLIFKNKLFNTDYNIEEVIEKAKNNYNIGDDGIINKYGLIRISFIEIIYDYLSKHDIAKFESDLNNLESILKKNNYSRELHVLNFIKKINYCNIDDAIILKILKSYPILVQ